MSAHFNCGPAGITRNPLRYELDRLSDRHDAAHVIHFESDVPAIPPAFIASPVSMPTPPWGGSAPAVNL